MSKHENDPKKLPILKPLIGFMIFIAFLVVCYFVLSAFSNQRKSAVYKTYADETNSYIAKNSDGLATIFNQIFLKCNDPSTTCTSALSAQIPRVLKTDLKDWSSTIFLKQMDNQIYQMSLSGEISEFYSYPEDKRILIQKLLNGEVSQIPWDEYTYTFPNKEVVIPVKDNSGHVIGAIMRGVIEQKSF